MGHKYWAKRGHRRKTVARKENKSCGRAEKKKTELRERKIMTEKPKITGYRK